MPTIIRSISAHRVQTQFHIRLLRTPELPTNLSHMELKLAFLWEMSHTSGMYRLDIIAGPW